MTEFLKRLDQIKNNPEQFVALRRDKSCVVIAGPGSGKTFLLAMKVAKLLNEDVFSPHQIACLTYSRLLVRQIKNQLQELGALQDDRLVVGTVHGFCLGNIIKPYAHLFNEVNLPDPLRFASNEERISAVENALEDLGFNTIKLVP